MPRLVGVLRGSITSRPVQSSAESKAKPQLRAGQKQQDHAPKPPPSTKCGPEIASPVHRSLHESRAHPVATQLASRSVAKPGTDSTQAARVTDIYTAPAATARALNEQYGSHRRRSHPSGSCLYGGWLFVPAVRLSLASMLPLSPTAPTKKQACPVNK